MGAACAFRLYVHQTVSYLQRSKTAKWTFSIFLFARYLRTVGGENGLLDPKLSLDEATRAAFAGAPLVSLGLENHVSFYNREELKQSPVSSQLPFDVSRHPQAHSAVAGFMMDRLTAEMKHYADLQNHGKVAKYKHLLDQDIEAYARYRLYAAR